MKSTNATKSGTVDEYLAALAEEPRAAMMNLRATIRAAAPLATEKISYGMPTFQQSGGLVGYAAFTHHYSFYPMSPETQAQFADELAGFEMSRGTIRFTADHPIPADIVTRIVQARIAENEAR